MAHVAIVGAGPAGATLSYLLARNGIDVTLFERHTDFAREFRGEVLFPGGLHVIEEMGLWPRFDALPQVEIEALRFYFNGRLRGRIALDAADFGARLPRWVSQPALLEMLVAEASTQPTFRFERGVTVRDLIVENGRCVGVRAAGPAGEREYRAELLVGSDGRSSVVRARAGLVIEKSDPPMDVVWCKMPMPPAFADDPALHAYVGAGHLLLAAPIHDGSLQFGWIIPKGSYGDLKKRGIAEWIEEISHVVDADLAAHLRRYRNDALQPFLLSTASDRLRTWSTPGLLVIGDAAHTMSPVGAQGINIALRDAVVAANHLVPILTTDGTALQIDAATARIQAERLPEIAAIQRLQALPPRFLLRDAWWVRWAVAILPLFLRFAPVGRNRVFRSFAIGVTDVTLQV
jgi:2-polyprenyl-6-methoxyphenol hydroxylase-like FAD-dependent oxidoreductase